MQNIVQAISTASGLATALSWREGVQNSFVQLTNLYRTKLYQVELIKIIKEHRVIKTFKQLQQYPY